MISQYLHVGDCTIGCARSVNETHRQRDGHRHEPRRINSHSQRDSEPGWQTELNTDRQRDRARDRQRQGREGGLTRRSWRYCWSVWSCSSHCWPPSRVQRRDSLVRPRLNTHTHTHIKDTTYRHKDYIAPCSTARCYSKQAAIQWCIRVFLPEFVILGQCLALGT